MLTVTEHGKNRVRQRCGIKVKAVKRLARIAYEKGLTPAETTGALSRYMLSLYNYNGTADNIRIYGDKVFVFCKDVLVTVLYVPREYLKTVNKLMVKRRQEGGCNDT